MSIQYPNGAMHCGTCPYWRGERKVTSSGFIEVKDSRATGTCGKSGNAQYGKQMQAYECCPKWTKG
jgi:hypothetical protein